MAAPIGRHINMNFITMGVVEVFSPEYMVAGVAAKCSGRVPRSNLWDKLNSVSPGVRVTIACGTAPTKCPEDKATSAWKPSRKRRDASRKDEVMVRQLAGRYRPTWSHSMALAFVLVAALRRL